MSKQSLEQNPPAGSPLAILRPIVLAIFIGFLMTGLPIAVIPLQVSHALGFGPVVVGAIVGAQFVASLASRPLAGRLSDSRGAKVAVVTGFTSAAVAGALYLVSLLFVGLPLLSLGILAIARVALGAAESMVATGSLAWGVARLGPARAGIVMVWVGNAIFAALAFGAPLGGELYRRWGLSAVGVAALVVPLAALAILRRVANVKPVGGARVPFASVLRRVALPGFGLALSSVGFGTITAFVALLFVARQWAHPALAFTAFGIAFIVARLLFGELPDRIGGARVALAAVAVGAIGQGMIALAASPTVATLGAALSGAGYSLAFPAFGVEAVRRAPAQARGAAMGAYIMFLDVALGFTGPAAGYVVRVAGYPAMYLASAAVMLASLAVAWTLLRESTTPAAAQMSRGD
jgi:MFS family permease